MCGGMSDPDTLACSQGWQGLGVLVIVFSRGWFDLNNSFSCVAMSGGLLVCKYGFQFPTG